MTCRLIGMRAVVATVCLVATASVTLAADVEDRLLADIARATGRGAQLDFISGFDFLCFAVNATAAKQEFLPLSQRLSSQLARSVADCGTKKSCCNVSSNAAGVVGLVKNDQISCIEINKFDYWPKDNEPICLKPSQLVTTAVTRPFAEIRPGRPRYRAGRPSFEITEQGK
jgi:hypothetical protein